MFHIPTQSPSSRTCLKDGLVGEIIVIWYDNETWLGKCLFLMIRANSALIYRPTGKLMKRSG